jgi:hypothetical protein
MGFAPNYLGAIDPGFPLESPAQAQATRNVSCRKSFLAKVGADWLPSLAVGLRRTGLPRTACDRVTS